MTGAPVILVELSSVDIRWLIHETLPGAIFEKNNK
jgi:hypothetical protein